MGPFTGTDVAVAAEELVLFTLDDAALRVVAAAEESCDELVDARGSTVRVVSYFLSEELTVGLVRLKVVRGAG